MPDNASQRTRKSSAPLKAGVCRFHGAAGYGVITLPSPRTKAQRTGLPGYSAAAA